MDTKTIIFPTDLSPLSNSAWPLARSLARSAGAEVVIVHVRQLPTTAADGESEASEPGQTLEQLGRGENGLRVERQLVHGDPATEIVRLAEERRAMLIVMTTHGRTGLSRVLMGSVAAAVLRQTQCSVLTVREANLDEGLDFFSSDTAAAISAAAETASERPPATEASRRPSHGGHRNTSPSGSRTSIDSLLDRLAADLETEPGSAGYPHWAGRLRAALRALEPVLFEILDRKHPEIYAQIKDADDDLFVRVEGLKQTDRELRSRAGEFRQRLEAFICDASVANQPPSGLQQQATALIQRGQQLVADTRQQVEAVSHWLVEAFNRDRGAVD